MMLLYRLSQPLIPIALWGAVTASCGSVMEKREASSSTTASATTGDVASAAGGSGSTSGGGGASTGAGGSDGTGGVADCTAPQISVLAAGQNEIEGLALDDTSIYWSNYDHVAQKGQIRRIAKAGGAVGVIANIAKFAPWDIAVDATRVYWSTRTSTSLNGFSYPEIKIYSAPKAGGPSAKTELASVFDAVATGLALDDTRVYWSTTRDVILSTLKDNTEGPTTVLAANPKFQLLRRNIAVDADHVYWMEGAVDILSMPKSGGMPTALATQPPDAFYFAMDAMRIYWGDTDLGHISSIPRGGGAPKILVSGEDRVIGVAVNSSCVYWMSSNLMDLRVRAAPKSGGAAITIATLQQSTKYVVVADETHVYWEDRATHSIMQANK